MTRSRPDDRGQGTRGPKPPSMPPLSGGGQSSTSAAETFLAEETGRMRRRLQWFMGGRLLAVTLLLGGFLSLTPRAASSSTFTTSTVWFLIGATYAASLVFAVRMARSPDSPEGLRALANLQLGFDLILTSGLIYVSGGAGSGFTFLYGTSILMAAVIVGPGASYVTAITALFLYFAVGVAESIGSLPAPPDQSLDRYQLANDELAIAVLTNVVGFLLVTILASSLAERLRATGGELRKAAMSAARLVKLNDDIVRSIPSGLLTVDHDGVIRNINPAGAAILDRTGQEIEGRVLAELLPIDLLGTAHGQRSEGTGLRRSGERFPIGYTHTPLIDAEGRKLGTLVVFQDLTEIVELKEAKERAERLASLGRLAAGLAHEIRNPLGSISGSVQLVRENEHLDADESRLLGLVLTEVDRLNDLVTTMLEIGRPRKPVRERVDVARLTREVVEVARRGVAQSAQVRIVALSEDSAEAEVDPNQVRQVLWNLLKNAIQATAAGGEVEVRAHVTSAALEGADAVVIEVADNGIGIAESELERVFEMFYSARQHGVGLGLALVRQLTEAHGGRVEVQSERGKGAKFRAFFPVRPA